MDGLAGRTLLLASLFLGAALFVGSLATAQYLASTRLQAGLSCAMARQAPMRQPATLDDDLVTSALAPVHAPKPSPTCNKLGRP